MGTDPPKFCKNGDGRAFSIVPGSGGKRVYFGRYGTDEAKAKYRAWLIEWAKGDAKPVERAEYTFSVIDDYLTWAQERYGKGSREFGNLHKFLGRFLEFIGQRRVDRLGPGTLYDFQAYVAGLTYRSGAEQKRYPRSTINRHTAYVIRAIKWAAGREIIPPTIYHSLLAFEPLKRGESDAPETEAVAPVSVEVIRATMPHLPAMVADIVRVQLHCGMRPGEALGMRLEHLDRSGPVWFYRPPKHKTAHKGKSLVKMVPVPAQEAIKRWAGDRSAGYVFRPADGLPEHLAKAKRSDKQLGEHYRRDSYTNAIKRGCELAFGMPEHLRDIGRHIKRQKKLTDAERKELRGLLSAEAAAWRKSHCWSPNQLRHTAATLAKQQQSVSAAQTLLGHATPDTTQLYIERQEAELKRLAETLTFPEL